jgi:hypothetical protein
MGGLFISFATEVTSVSLPENHQRPVSPSLGDDASGGKDAYASRQHEGNNIDTRLLGRVRATLDGQNSSKEAYQMPYSLVKERKLVGTAQHDGHEEEHGC